MLNLQPCLIGERIRLQPLEASDFETACAVASDPLLWEQHPDKSRSTRAGFESFFSQALASRGSLVGVDGRANDLIGCTRMYRKLCVLLQRGTCVHGVRWKNSAPPIRFARQCEAQVVYE